MNDNPILPLDSDKDTLPLVGGKGANLARLAQARLPVPGGFLINFEGRRLYHAGDTALLTDMGLLKGQVDVALLPIGDNFTMGPDDAVRAVEFIEPEVVIPIHYNTFDMIAQDAEAFRAKVGNRARVEIIGPGESYEF